MSDYDISRQEAEDIIMLTRVAAGWIEPSELLSEEEAAEYEQLESEDEDGLADFDGAQGEAEVEAEAEGDADLNAEDNTDTEDGAEDEADADVETASEEDKER